MAQLQRSGDWRQAGELLARAANSLAGAGAECLLICANTMHIVAPAVEAAVKIPLLHIADPTATAIRQAGISRVGLLGTRFVMEEAFYRNRLTERYGLRVIIPEVENREIIHRIIFDELCLGKVMPESRIQFREVMAELQREEAEAIILGCTEFSLLVGQADCVVPLFDTMRLHAQKAVEWALSMP